MYTILFTLFTLITSIIPFNPYLKLGSFSSNSNSHATSWFTSLVNKYFASGLFKIAVAFAKHLSQVSVSTIFLSVDVQKF